jgi:hypothetical protein
MKKILLIILLIGVCKSIVFCKNYFVATNGKDADAGTKLKPQATVRKAQDLASAGDTVYIRGGTYMIKESQINKTSRIYAYVFNLNKSGASG